MCKHAAYVTQDAGMHASYLPRSIQADYPDNPLSFCAALLTPAGPGRCDCSAMQPCFLVVL